MKWVEVECVAEEVEGPLIERLLSLEVRAKQEDRAAAISECISGSPSQKLELCSGDRFYPLGCGIPLLSLLMESDNAEFPIFFFFFPWVKLGRAA